MGSRSRRAIVTWLAVTSGFPRGGAGTFGPYRSARGRSTTATAERAGLAIRVGDVSGERVGDVNGERVGDVSGERVGGVSGERLVGGGVHVRSAARLARVPSPSGTRWT